MFAQAYVHVGFVCYTNYELLLLIMHSHRVSCIQLNRSEIVPLSGTTFNCSRFGEGEDLSRQVTRINN